MRQHHPTIQPDHPPAVPARRPPVTVFLFLLLALLAACQPVVFTPTRTPQPGRLPRGEPPAEASWYEIYFTNPTCPPEHEQEGGIDEIITADLLEAQQSVDLAAYDLDAARIVDALVTLQTRGIEVRVVTDTDNETLSSINRLRRNRISVVTDDRSGIMHNKFIVIDRRVVWTGSMNLTSNGVYCNNNNMVRFDSVALAANYRAEMDEMYIQRSFGPTSPAGTPNTPLAIGDVQIENYFGPEERIAPTIAALVAEAEEHIQFMAFSFTNEDIGEAMLARAEAGVLVEGVFERTGSETVFSYYPVLRDAGLPNVHVLQDGNPRIMHHKVIIIDGRTVIFGSFNFSNSANDQNDENVIIVHDPTFTRYFLEEFDFVRAEALEVSN